MTVQTPSGSAIVCGGRAPRRRCWKCAKAADFLCDGPMTDGKTCDRPMCDDHRIDVGGGRDVCQPCRARAGEAAGQGRLFG